MKKLQYGIVLLCIVTLWGCGKGNANAPTTIDPVTGKHSTPGWAANGTGGVHPDAYFANASSCEECHGKIGTDDFAKGGISGVSCSNPGRSGVACHPSFPHAAGFAAFAIHGSVARDVASGITGMAHCQKCHGSSYTGAGAAPNCIGCHKVTNPSSNAPHAANWVGGNANGLRHSLTNETNAPACAQCHLGGTFSHAAPNPAPAGTAPGCFNGTLCHNNAGHTLIGYVVGHRADAKANLASCQTCHAVPASGANPRFNLLKGTGVLNPNGCEGCHNRPGLAHPYMWLPGRGGSTTSHATAGTVNVSCGLCHGGTALTGGSVAYPGGIAPPSCFPASSINGTVCHFTKPVDASGTSVGCTSCHGNPPNGATAPNQAFRHSAHFSPTNNLAGLTCSACHNGLGSGIATHATAATATVSIDPKFNEDNNGVAVPSSYSTTTQQCTNVSCHGGRIGTFPKWKDGVAFDQTRCTNCHLTLTTNGVLPSTYTGLYIGPFSGDVSAQTIINTTMNNLHNFHARFAGSLASPWLVCAKCHAIPVAGHFAKLMLGKRTLEPNIALGTIGGAGTLVKSYSYDGLTGKSSCLQAPGAACHNDPTAIKSWYKNQ